MTEDPGSIVGALSPFKINLTDTGCSVGPQGRGRAVLLAPGGGPVRTQAAGWRDWLEIVEVDSIGHNELSAVLVRPDGAIAWVAAPGLSADIASLREALRTWFGTSR